MLAFVLLAASVGALADKCDRLMPYERLRFDAGTGKFIDRSFINQTDKSGG